MAAPERHSDAARGTLADRRPTVAQPVTEIVANIRSLETGGRLLQEIDKTMGY